MKKLLWAVLEILETIIVSVLAVFLIRSFLFQPFLVSGASMEPSFSSGDYLLIDEISYRLRPPQRGEVIVFKPPVAGDFFIKRIIGLPNEKIRIQDGQIEIFNAQSQKITLKENYLPLNVKTSGDSEIILGANQYLVLGDNRNYSFDSRVWGPLTGDHIIGLVKLRIWPLDMAMAFEKPNY
jgi:signal peptidase I